MIRRHFYCWTFHIYLWLEGVSKPDSLLATVLYGWKQRLKMHFKIWTPQIINHGENIDALLLYYDVQIYNKPNAAGFFLINALKRKINDTLLKQTLQLHLILTDGLSSLCNSWEWIHLFHLVLPYTSSDRTLHLTPGSTERKKIKVSQTLSKQNTEGTEICLYRDKQKAKTWQCGNWI